MFAQAMEAAGFARRVPDPRFIERTRVMAFAHILAGRPKDLDDAAALWRLHGAGFDEARIRGVLAELESALSQSDLLPALEQIAGRRR
jgi:hypothetical protein